MLSSNCVTPTPILALTAIISSGSISNKLKICSLTKSTSAPGRSILFRTASIWRLCEKAR